MNTPIWADPDVRAICDWQDGQPMPRFAEFNAYPEQAGLVFAFVKLDMQNGEDTPASDYIEACLAGIRAVEELADWVHPGWIKFLVCQIDRNNSLLWEQYRQPADIVAAVGEWLVTTIRRFGWGPGGNSTPLGQRHSNSMAVAAEAGGGIRSNSATGLFQYGDGAEARRLAGVEIPAVSAQLEQSFTKDSAAYETEDPLARLVDAAADGDEASHLIIEGAAAHGAGEIQRALALYERAARLGDPQGMLEAGVLYRRNGDGQSAVFWLEAAASAGSLDAYGHLASFAEEAGDVPREREWSRRGAEAGHVWSMGTHAYFLLTDAHGALQAGSDDSEVLPVLRECFEYATRAASHGQVNAMFSAGLASAFMDRRRDALEWLTRAEEHGHTDARRMIQQLGLG